MNMQLLIGIGVTVSIFLAVLTEGMAVSGSDIRYLFSRPRRLVRTLLAMIVLGPIVTVLVCQLFDLHPAVIVALVTLSIAPVGALFPQTMLPLMKAGHGAYAHGLFFATTLLSVILTPLAVEVINLLFGSNVHVNPLTVAQVAIGGMLLPLGIGLALGRWRPQARALIPAVQKVSSLLLAASFVAILAVAWPGIAEVVRQGTLSAIVIITLVGLAVGHFLGGPDEDDRTVLAFATVSRHPGVAMAVASLVDEPLAPIGVLVAVIAGELAAAPYKKWRKRLRAQTAGPAGGEGPPTAAAH